MKAATAQPNGRGGFQVNQTIRRQLAAAVGKITARLEAAKGGQAPLGHTTRFSGWIRANKILR